MIGTSLRISLLSTLILLATAVVGQLEIPENISAAKLKKMAQHAEDAGDVYSAISYYEEFLSKRQDDHGTMFHVAELYEKTRNYPEARQLYNLVYKNKAASFPIALYNEGRMFKMEGNYAEAKSALTKYQNSYKNTDEYKQIKKLVLSEIAGCDSAAMYMDKALNVNLERLPNEVNQGHIEFSPIPWGENQLVYGSFPASDFQYYHVDSLAPKRRFYLAEQADESWIPLGELPGPFNSPNHNTGNGAISADGEHFYYSVCEKNWKGKMICELWVAEKAGTKWVNEKSLGLAVNDGFSNSMPTVGIETKRNKEIIYFVSDRPGGRGGLDIWYTIYNEKKDEYKAPKNAGSKLNTEGDELTPYFNLFEHKLYFSSTGYPGLGGLDIFSSRGDQRKWSTPKNIGYPINSSADDLYYIAEKGNDSGYLVSNRKGGNQLMHETCCDDIYHFAVLDYIHIALEGMIVEIDEEDYLDGRADEISFNLDLASQTIRDAKIVLLIKEENEYVEINNTKSSKRGTYFLDLEAENEYRLMVSKEGFFNNHVDFNTRGITHSDTLVQHIGLSRLNPESIVIKDIYYEFDKSELTAEALTTIDNSLLLVLHENPTLKIELSSHTDNRGEVQYNQNLSQKRAESVVNYLIAKGIKPERLIPRGYGESSPKAANENPDGSDNPEGRQMNRRTEFKIIGEIPGVEIYEID